MVNYENVGYIPLDTCKTWRKADPSPPPPTPEVDGLSNSSSPLSSAVFTLDLFLLSLVGINPLGAVLFSFF